MKEDPETEFKKYQFNSEKFLLSDIYSLGMAKHFEAIQDISIRASKEEGLVIILDKIRDFLTGQKSVIETESYKGFKDINVLTANEELIKLLDSNIVLATNILSSRYVGGIKHLVTVQKKRLDYYQELLDEWFAC